jgi:hypothetical protein
MSGRRENLHRNNLAEWVMYVALLPFVPVVWLLERIRKSS